MICRSMSVIVANPMRFIVVMMMVVVVRVMCVIMHSFYSTSGPAGMVTGSSIIDLCAPILPCETSGPGTSTITRVASRAVMSEVS